MMISTNSTTLPASTRPNRVCVLEPPRHSKLLVRVLSAGRHLIGSDESCAIHLATDGVVPRHAMIFVGDQKIILKAFDPRTWVNDFATTEASLRPGDKISIGPFTFLLRYAKPGEADEVQSVSARNVADVPTAVAPVQPPSAPIIEREPRPIAVPAVQVEEKQTQPVSQRPVEEASATVGVMPPSVSEERIAHPIKDNQTCAEVSSEPPHDVVASVAESVPDVRAEGEISAATPPIEVQRDELRSLSDEPVLSVADAEPEPGISEDVVELVVEAQQDNVEPTVELLAVEDLESVENQEPASALEDVVPLEACDGAEDAVQPLVVHDQLVVNEPESVPEHTLTEATSAESEVPVLVADEHVQGETKIQEWEAGYLSAIEDFKAKSVALEEQRLELQVEREQLRQRRDEIQSLHSELVQQRASLTAEREQLSADVEQHNADVELHKTEVEQHKTEVAEFQTEQQRQADEWQERETRFQTKQRLFAGAQQELAASRLQLDQERLLQSTERSEETQQFSEQLANERAEIQRLNAECERERILLNADRDRLNQERSNLNSESTELQTQREQFSAELLEYQVQIDAERRAVETSQQELASARLQFEQDKVALLEERSADAIRREQESRERANFHLQMNEKEIALEKLRLNLELQQAQLEAARTAPQPLMLSSSISQVVPPPIPEIPRSRSERDSDHSSMSQSGYAGDVPSTELEVPAFLRSRLESHSTSQPVVVGQPAEAWSTAELQNFGTEDQVESKNFAESPSTLSDQTGSIEQTLSEINQRFGLAPSVSSDPSATAFRSEATGATEASSSGSASAAPDQSVSDLRAQLARMFDLSPDSAQNEGSTDQDDDSEMTRDYSAADSSQSAETSGITESQPDYSSTPSEPAQSETVEPAAVADEPQEEAGDQEEDPWMRRLREYTKVSGGSSAPAAAPSPPPVPKVTEPEPTAESKDEDEYSVEAQLARLLGRSKPSTQEFHEANKPAEKAVEKKPAQEPEPVAVSHDRSHLSEAPRHRQNKSAVREEVQSFRAVAQMSARTALAKHSWNNLRNQIYFKAGMTAISVIAAIWFGVSYLIGSDRQAWKVLVCAVAMVACLYNLYQTWLQFKELQQGNRRDRSTQKTNDGPAEESNSNIDPDKE